MKPLKSNMTTPATNPSEQPNAEPARDLVDAAVRNYSFRPWVNPDQLILHPDGTMTMKDGGDVREYWRQWLAAMGKSEPTAVTFMTRDHAELVNLPHCA